MKVLFDTNIILDVLLDRAPFSEDAALLLSKVERTEITGFLCASTITTIHYLTSKVLTPELALKHIHSILGLFEIAPVNRIVLENALEAQFTDFEDAVLYEAACHTGANYIITRNVSDFKKSTLPVFTPDEFLNMLQTIEEEG